MPSAMQNTVAQLLDLTDRVAVVTGSGAGMGAATVKLLAAAGARVVVVDVDPVRATTVTDAITADGGHAESAVVDVRDVEAITTLVNDVADRHGRLDIWVNNAGIYPASPLFTATVQDWDRMLDINSRSVFFATREAARRMIDFGKGGVIVNISSIAAYRAGSPSLAHYAASKGAVVALTKTLAGSLGPHGVRVVGVAPGVIETEGLQVGKQEMDSSGANLSNRGAMVPLRRVGQGEDIARAVLFAVSDMAGFVTGDTLSVDGGDLIRATADVPDLAAMGYTPRG